MNNKEKQIEEIYNLLFCAKWEQPFTECPEDIKCIDCIARKLYEQGYRKIDKDIVIIPKEISCYENIEKRVRTFRLDGNEVDFSQEQIMALTQIFSFKEKQENEIRKETAEKILREFEYCNDTTFYSKWFELCKQNGVKIGE